MKAKKVLAAIAALTTVLTTTAAPFCTVYAADGDTAAVAEKADTTLKITGLTKPTVGRNLVRSCNVSFMGKTWKLSVNWTTKKGKAAYKAVYGETYIPYITLWVPKDVDNTALLAALKSNVYLPDFIKNPSVITEKFTSGEDGAVSGQVWYLTANAITPVRTTTGSAGSGEGSGGGGGIAPASASESAEPAGGSGSSDGEGGGSTPAPAAAETPAPASVPATPATPAASGASEDDDYEVSRLARLQVFALDQYDALLEKYGEELLCDFVDEIVFVLEPQAVNLLAKNFPAFAKAIEEEQITAETGFVLDAEIPALGGFGGYWEGENGKWFSALTINPDWMFAHEFVEDEETGEVKMKLLTDENGNPYIDDNGWTVLENTLTHEMMHAFMYDYTRGGMLNGENEFPLWFTEGAASMTDDCYAYRIGNYYELMSSEDPGTGEVTYNPFNIVTNYWNLTKKDEEGNPTADRAYDITLEDGRSEYVIGYLADMYLSILAYQAYVSDEPIGFGADNDGLSEEERADLMGTTCSEMLCEGLNAILERLHEGDSLDEVIADISSKVDGVNFDDTEDFEREFLDGDNSSDIYAAMLMMLFREFTEINEGELPAGNVLLPLNTPDGTFLAEAEADDVDAFEITGDQPDDGDYPGYVESTVEGLTGGGRSPENAVAVEVEVLDT